VAQQPDIQLNTTKMISAIQTLESNQIKPSKSNTDSIWYEMRQNRKLRFIVPGSVMMIVGSLIMFGYIFSTWQTSNISNTTSVVELPQTGVTTADTNQSYYAPLLKLSFINDSDNYVFHANKDNINITIINDYDFSADIYKLNNDSIQQFIDNQTKIYTQIYNDVTFTKLSNSDDTIQKFEFQYDRYLDNQKNVSQHITNVYMFKNIEQDTYILQATFNTSYPQVQNQLDELTNLFNSLKSQYSYENKNAPVIQTGQNDINFFINHTYWSTKINTQETSGSLRISNEKNNILNSPLNFILNWQNVDKYYDDSILSEGVKSINLKVNPNTPIKDKDIILGKQIIDGNTFDFVEYENTRYYLGYIEKINKIIAIETQYSPSDQIIINHILSNISFGTMPQLPETGTMHTQLNDYSTLTTQLSTLTINNYICADLFFNQQSDPHLLCSNQFGTGYIINENGFALTESQITTPSNLNTIANALFYGFDPDNLYKIFENNALNTITTDDSNPHISALNKHDYDNYIHSIIINNIKSQISNNKISISNIQPNVYIQGEELFEFDYFNKSLIHTSQHWQAQIVSTYQNTTTNLSLIKLINLNNNNAKYPSISLTNFVELNGSNNLLETQAFLTKNNIIISDTNAINQLVKSAIDNYNKKFYKFAKHDLELVTKSSTITTPVISVVIDDLIVKISAGEDISPMLQLGSYALYQNDIITFTITFLVAIFSLLTLIKSMYYLKDVTNAKRIKKRRMYKEHPVIKKTQIIGLSMNKQNHAQ